MARITAATAIQARGREAGVSVSGIHAGLNIRMARSAARVMAPSTRALMRNSPSEIKRIRRGIGKPDASSSDRAKPALVRTLRAPPIKIDADQEVAAKNR